MVSRYLAVQADANGKMFMQERKLEQMVVLNNSLISIDGSTSNTGLALIDGFTGNLIGTASFKRGEENAVRYKVELKREVESLIRQNGGRIQNSFYEEPYIGYAGAVANMFMLRTFLEEIKIENEPEFDYMGITEISNKKWKKYFIGKTTDWMSRFAGCFASCKSESDREKVAIKLTLLGYMPFLDCLTQDEMDAAAMGMVARKMLSSGEEKQLKSRGKKSQFAYNITFFGCSDDDVVLQDIVNNYKKYRIPLAVMQNGIMVRHIGGNGIFENKIWDLMFDEDKLLVMRWQSSKHGDIILKYKLGMLAAENEYLYAAVWRKNRMHS